MVSEPLSEEERETLGLRIASCGCCYTVDSVAFREYAARTQALEAERDRLRETNDRLNRRAQIAESAINELATGTGGGKLRPLAREMWERCQTTHERGCHRAEAAEAEVADLRSRLACVLEATYWDRPYDARIAAVRGMSDLSTNGLTPSDGGDAEQVLRDGEA